MLAAESWEKMNRAYGTPLDKIRDIQAKMADLAGSDGPLDMTAAAECILRMKMYAVAAEPLQTPDNLMHVMERVGELEPLLAGLRKSPIKPPSVKAASADSDSASNDEFVKELTAIKPTTTKKAE